MRLRRRRPSPCRRPQRELHACMDGEAGIDTAWRVARHLSRCQDCFQEATTVRVIKDTLAGLRVPPNDDTPARLRALVTALTDARPGI